MKKIYSILIIILCVLCLTGCGSNNDSKSNESKYKDTYTHSDLIIHSDYDKINDFLNGLFNELNFDGKMRLASSNESEDYFTFAYINEKADTVFTFYFDKDESFMFVNIIYDKYNNGSVYLAKEVIKYSKFGFSTTDLSTIKSIITSSSATDDTIVGNYIVSNLSSGNMSIKSKDKYGKEDNTKKETQTSNNTQSNTQSNSNKNNNTNSNNQTNTQSNNNSNTQQNNQQQTQPENNTPSVSISKQNALKSAQSYLSFSAFSRKGLIEQLEYEKYSTEDATYAVDNCGANWNEQALKSTKSYLNTSAFSYSGLKEQLEYEGFTSEQASYGVNNCGANWNEQAVKSAKSYLSFSSFSHDGLVEQLEYEGFTHEQAEYGVTQNGL